MAFENVLHITPNAIANFNNIYDPNGGAVTGAFSLVNFSNPVQFDLRHDRRRREHHRAGDGETVRAVPRSGVAAAELNDLPIPINPYLRPAINPDRIDLHRSQACAGWRRPAAIRRNRRRRCPRTPERAISRRRRDGTGRPAHGRASTRPAAPRPARSRRTAAVPRRAADRGTARHLEHSGRRVRRSRGCCSRRQRRRRRRAARRPNAPLLPAEGTPPS